MSKEVELDDFHTPPRGMRSAPATMNVDRAESEHITTMAKRKCLFPSTSPKNTTVADDDGGELKQLQKNPLKPASFYGNSAPMLARNETNMVGGVKKVYRLAISKARVKLFSDPQKRKRSPNRSSSAVLFVGASAAKRPRKQLYTGVGHALRPIRPVVAKKRASLDSAPGEPVAKKSPRTPKTPKTPKSNDGSGGGSLHDRIFNSVDFSHVPYTKQRSRSGGYIYPAMKFTKNERTEVTESNSEKRRFFKTKVNSPNGVSYGISLPMKKRKLLNPDEDFMKIIKKEQVTRASDILDLIEDGKVVDEEEQRQKSTLGVDGLILQLEDEGDDRGDNLFDITETTSNLSITDTPDKSILTPTKENMIQLRRSPRKSPRSTPRKLFAVFEKHSPRFRDLTNITPQSGGGSSAGASGTSSRKKWRPMGDKQYQIDAGQKRFGATQCPTCGIVYQLGDPDDEADHERYHNNYGVFKFGGWQNEKVVGQYGLDRVVLVTQSDPKSYWNKALALLKVVDDELGYPEEWVMSGLKVFMYISGKHIVGCVSATQVSHAYKMLLSESDVDVCSEETYPVKCGISRMWTQQMGRRQGVATKLMDCCRKNFLFGHFLGHDEIAFSTPTEDGKQFAKKYMGRNDYYVYTGW